jgi:hypothetical protein
MQGHEFADHMKNSQWFGTTRQLQRLATAQLALKIIFCFFRERTL